MMNPITAVSTPYHLKNNWNDTSLSLTNRLALPKDLWVDTSRDVFETLIHQGLVSCYDYDFVLRVGNFLLRRKDPTNQVWGVEQFRLNAFKSMSVMTTMPS